MKSKAGKIYSWLLILAAASAIGAGILTRGAFFARTAAWLGFERKAAEKADKAVFYCPMHPTYTSDRPGDCPICNMKLVKREPSPDVSKPSHAPAADVYYCPMHPTYTSDRPGDCPICNMKLVKREQQAAEVSGPSSRFREICYMHNCPMVHEGKICPMLVVASLGEQVLCPVCGAHVSEEKPLGAKEDLPAGYAAILISPQKRQLIGVKTAVASKEPLTKMIRTVGRVLVDETRIVHIHPKVEGWIEEIYAKYEGDAVKKGQPLFSYYSPDFVSTQEEYLASLKLLRSLPAGTDEKTVNDAHSNVESSRKRLLLWDITEKQISDLELRGTPSKTLALISPIDGVVLKKKVYSGQFMERGADFYELADLSRIWVDADIYEYELPLLKLGQDAVITMPTDEKRQFRGKVIYLSPVLKPETRTAVARMEFDNPESLLKPEMFVNVRIQIKFGERIVIPREAVMDTGVRKIVFMGLQDGVLEPREVETGVRTDQGIEITKGLAEGESVVVSGNFLIDSESRLKAAMDGMAAPMPGHDHGAKPAEKEREAPKPTEHGGHQHG